MRWMDFRVCARRYDFIERVQAQLAQERREKGILHATFKNECVSMIIEKHLDSFCLDESWAKKDKSKKFYHIGFKIREERWKQLEELSREKGSVKAKILRWLIDKEMDLWSFQGFC